jgi:hypothetical protein
MQQGDAGRTRKLPPDEPMIPRERETETPEQVNPDWRKRRKRQPGSRPMRRSPSTSPQELQVWLQQGGWLYVAGAAFLCVAALVAMLVFTRSGGERQVAGQDSPSSSMEQEGGGRGSGAEAPPLPAENGNGTLQTLPTVTPEPPTPELLPSPTPATFVVANTGGQGLFLRDDHSVNSNILETLPDGTQVEQVGEDFTGASYVWREVRAPSGQVGWVSVDWLAPAPAP